MFEESTTKYFNNLFGPGTNSGGCETSVGFNSIAGHWTPLTGLGSPRFAQIRQYVARLQCRQKRINNLGRMSKNNIMSCQTK